MADSAEIVHLFEPGDETTHKILALDAISLGINRLYPLELYAPTSRDGRLAERLHTALRQYFMQDVALEELPALRNERARVTLGYCLSSLVEVDPREAERDINGAWAQLERLRRSVGGDDTYQPFSDETTAAVIPLYPDRQPSPLLSPQTIDADGLIHSIK